MIPRQKQQKFFKERYPLRRHYRHCEELQRRSNPAIATFPDRRLRRFAALAITNSQ
jgi:hypothetical protein